MGSSLENSLVLCHPTATRIQVAPNFAIPNPGLFALHQLPRLQDCYDASCSARVFREAQDRDICFAYWCRNSNSLDHRS